MLREVVKATIGKYILNLSAEYFNRAELND